MAIQCPGDEASAICRWIDAPDGGCFRPLPGVLVLAARCSLSRGSLHGVRPERRAMAEPQTRRSTATGRAKRTDDPSTSDQPRITDENGAETTMTPDESPALTLSLTQEHALEVLLEEAKQQITEQVRERT